MDCSPRLLPSRDILPLLKWECHSKQFVWHILLLPETCESILLFSVASFQKLIIAQIYFLLRFEIHCEVPNKHITCGNYHL